MSRLFASTSFALGALLFPLLGGGCQLNRIGGVAASQQSPVERDDYDYYVQRALSTRWPDGWSPGPVRPVAYHGWAAGPATLPSSEATAQPIGLPAPGQYAPSTLQSLARPFHSSWQPANPRNSCSSFG
ncbi:MAG: hypothetical protein GTO53_10050 [Planctomycetales bacterium]|nr:hypothetical protein [Planctomycetales bacterium]NIM09462.1 hypothetical protein [Planctomycetales bacterium]NIN08950.1 hypothetical protein [Planctomycetales bacterium]NIN78065.1 hypothetical protein [Planctomycetales bacterium]NIO35243.1 hypothetical protein [Planctomycetales bacterium]